MLFFTPAHPPLENFDDETYYFGSNGAMVTNTWVAIDSSLVDEGFENYTPTNYWYYFQGNGKAARGNDTKPKTLTIDGKKYMFNKNGQMLVGWFTHDGEVQDPDDSEKNPFADAQYYAGGDNDGVLRAGWVSYYDGYNGDDDDLSDKSVLYFYFNLNNNQKAGTKTDGAPEAQRKIINNKTYAFNKEGVMYSGWDVVNHSGDDIPSQYSGQTVYFSDENDGHQVKKGWVYAVPPAGLDEVLHEKDEEKYMYFGSDGQSVKDTIKKVNSKWYCFDSLGIMKTGLVVWNTTDNVFKCTFDMDYAEGTEFLQKGIIRHGGETSDTYTINWDGNIGTDTTKNYKLHYFGEDGARKTGTNTIEFSDDAYTFFSNNQGDRGFGKVSKKYYAMGLLLKANSDIKFGIYLATESNVSSDPDPMLDSTNGAFAPQKDIYGQHLAGNYYKVLTTSGQLQEGSGASKKDADGNYWYIEDDTNYLKGIFDCEVKYGNPSSFTSKKLYKDTLSNLKNNLLASPSASSWTYTDIKASGSVAYADLPVAVKAIVDTEFTSTAVGAPTGSQLEFKVLSIAKNDKGDKFTSADTSINESTTDVYFTLKVSVNGKCSCFKSDYDGSSKSLPFGWKDDSGHYAKLDFEDVNYAAYHQVKPSSDAYFTNCYWGN